MKKYADIKVGYNCNNDCVHCVISDQRKRAIQLRGNETRSTKEYCDEILSSKSNGCERITVTGGEPTIRADFLDIIKFAKKEKLEIFLQTNARLFHKENFAKEVSCYVDLFIIPIHSQKKEIHEKITRRKNSFNETISGIKNLVKNDAKVGIKVVLLNYNYKDLIDILKLCKSLNVNNVNLAFPHANGNAYKNFKKIIPYYKDIREFVEKAIEFSIQENLKIDFEEILPCALSKEYPLSFFLDLKIVRSESELKQLDGDVQDWNLKRKESKRKGVICKKCIYNRFCEGYWKEYVEKRGFSEFKPIAKIPKELRKILLENLKAWKR